MTAINCPFYCQGHKERELFLHFQYLNEESQFQLSHSRTKLQTHPIAQCWPIDSSSRSLKYILQFSRFYSPFIRAVVLTKDYVCLSDNVQLFTHKSLSSHIVHTANSILTHPRINILEILVPSKSKGILICCSKKLPTFTIIFILFYHLVKESAI